MIERLTYLDPRDAKLYFLKSRSLQSLASNRSRNARPEDVRALRLYARHVIEIGLELAKAPGEKAEAYSLLGHLARTQGQIALAKTYYRQSLKLEPGNKYIQKILEDFEGVKSHKP